MSDFQSTMRTAFDLRAKLKAKPDDLVPRPLVQAMIGLMVAMTVLVAWTQLTGQPNAGVLQEAPIIAERQVVLTGDRAGNYVATDVDGGVIALSSENKAGFIGVIGRVFDRERATQGATSDAPIRVVRRTNGHVAIIDDTTGMVVELIGYGADNVAAFARMLD